MNKDELRDKLLISGFKEYSSDIVFMKISEDEEIDFTLDVNMERRISISFEDQMIHSYPFPPTLENINKVYKSFTNEDLVFESKESVRIKELEDEVVRLRELTTVPSEHMLSLTPPTGLPQGCWCEVTFSHNLLNKGDIVLIVSGEGSNTFHSKLVAKKTDTCDNTVVYANPQYLKRIE